MDPRFFRKYIDILGEAAPMVAMPTAPKTPTAPPAPAQAAPKVAQQPAKAQPVAQPTAPPQTPKQPMAMPGNTTPQQSSAAITQKYSNLSIDPATDTGRTGKNNINIATSAARG